MSRLSDDPGIGPVVVSEADLATRVHELGRQITADYDGRSLLLIGVLRGAFAFVTDLARRIDLHADVDFIAVSSYGNSTRTSGVVRLVKDLDTDIEGRDVLLVEDIVDTGLTLKYLRRSLLAREPASFEVCSLLARERSDLETLGVKYCGFRVPEDFVIGYGLDLDQRYRNLPYLATYAGDDAPQLGFGGRPVP